MLPADPCQRTSAISLCLPSWCAENFVPLWFLKLIIDMQSSHLLAGRFMQAMLHLCVEIPTGSVWAAVVEAGVGKMTWLIDFEGYSYRNAPPVTLAMKTLNVLQNHYPERLGLAVCYHPPKLFSITWKVSMLCSSSSTTLCCSCAHFLV